MLREALVLLLLWPVALFVCVGLWIGERYEHAE